MNRVLPAAFLLISFAGACGGDGSKSEPSPSADVLDAMTDAPLPEGAACDDADPCTWGDVVQGGVCKGTAYDCSVGAPWCVIARVCDGKGGCTATEIKPSACFIDGACQTAGSKNPKNPCGVCDPATSADAWTAVAGATACDDGDPCTLGDHCVAGSCKGELTSCDDSNPCTADSCDKTSGCQHAPSPGSCDDADACTVGDSCDNGVCKPGTEALSCDDANPCTVDTCEPKNGCIHALDPASACDDHNPCTKETCDPKTGCSHEILTGPCEDGNLCTEPDACVGGVCQPGPEKQCGEPTQCAKPFCVPTVGCMFQFLDGECDDGFPCTELDQCLGGHCAGVKTQSCEICTVAPNPEAVKVTVLQIPSGGNSGQGLDLDANPATCAPATDCSGGVDNELGLLAGFVNEGLTSSVQGGYLMYVIAFTDFDTTGKDFTVDFLASDLAESDKLCNFQASECKYHPYQDSLDPACNPVVHFDNAHLVGNMLVSGGPGYTFGLAATLMGGTPMHIAIADSRVQATVSLDSTGTHVTGMEGFIGGAVDKKELLSTIAALPKEVFGGMDKTQVIAFLDTVIENDLDSDYDNVPDRASVSIRFSAIPADLVPGP